MVKKNLIFGILRILPAISIIAAITTMLYFKEVSFTFDFSDPEKAGTTSGTYFCLLILFNSIAYLVINSFRQFKGLKVKFKLMYWIQVLFFLLVVLVSIGKMDSLSFTFIGAICAFDYFVFTLFFIVIDFISFYIKSSKKMGNAV